MADELLALSCDHLRPGMYVAELDRSWLQTPFAGPGLMLRSADEIATLANVCRYVYVDPARSLHGAVQAASRRDNHPDTLMQTELHAVRHAITKATGLLTHTLSLARRTDQFQLEPVLHAANLLQQQACRAPAASLWALRTLSNTGFIYRRAIGTAIHAIIFGRHLGFDEQELGHLAIGGLLLDIGKCSVPVPILAKPGRLSVMERQFITRHVTSGFSLVRANERLHPRITSMILGHHERLDGTGYPRQLKGTDIPLFARIAAIVDSYDALTLDRRYASGISGHDALRLLSALRERSFDAALVGEFVHAIGVYPIGTRVMMVDGRQGLVCQQDPVWPLRPLVVVTANATGTALRAPQLVASSRDGRIARSLPPAPVPHNLDELESTIPAAA